ncbi:MAG: AraC family transcriptional regulator [Anaerobiospirillum sp.]|nr:AraC family transcriptional regulator [Anaerobiospirillum sp.]
MIFSCLELVERIFEVAHCTVALIDTKSSRLLRYFPDHLSSLTHECLTKRAATMAGRVGQFKPIENTQDVALLGIDSTKVLVVGPTVLKDGSLSHFELKDLKYLNLLLETYASSISYDLIGTQDPAPAPKLSSGEAYEGGGDLYLEDKESDEWLAGLFAAFGGDLRAAPVLHHNPYRIEQAIKEAVRLGDEQLLQHAFAIPVTGREGRLALDELRSLKNHANLVNVICSRAAIEGGVSYEDAFRLSDQLFLMVESLNSNDKVFEVRYAIAHAFTMLVQHHLKEHNKTEVNIKVKQAMLYIRQHIYDKITVASVAQAVNCHRNYLQRLFKRDTTFSVVSYIRSEKLKVVKELLAHSDESVSNIAALLNFSSPSHLCTVFKEQVHLTPEQYRRRHRAPG